MTKPAMPSVRCKATLPALTSEACVASSASQSAKTVPWT
jgi:hypothetical protein